LYCEAQDSHIRKSTRTVLDKLFYNLLSLLAPILCFTAEEAWQSRLGKESSVHEVDFPALESNLINEDLTKKWELYKQLRKAINVAIEVKRKEKVVGSSLEASVMLYSIKSFNEIDSDTLKNISIISELTILNESPPESSYISESDKDVGIVVKKVDGNKCERCWKYYPNLFKDMCARCEQVVCK